MLQNKFEMPLDLEIKSSKLFYSYLVIIFLLSLVSVFLTSLAISMKFFLAFLLIVSVIFIVKKQKINKIAFIKLSSNDEWEIEINKQCFNVELYGECIVTHFLVWLNFTSCSSFGRKKVFHVLLLPDSADKDLLRQLRVRLRFLKDRTEDESKENIFHHKGHRGTQRE